MTNQIMNWFVAIKEIIMAKVSKKKVIKHLKGDIKSFKKEEKEDRELIHELRESKKHEQKEKKHKDPKGKKDPKPKPRTKMAKAKPKTKAGKKAKLKKVFHEAAEGKLRSGSKTGPVVTNPKQIQAIALSEAGISKPKKKRRKKK